MIRYNCFWVASECTGEPGTYSCKGCKHFPYGEGEVPPPGVPSDLGHQIMGVHVGLAELFAKKGIARPEEVDEAIARNIERLAHHDHILRQTVLDVGHVSDAMIRITEPGAIDVYVALDEEGEADEDAACSAVTEALKEKIPDEVEIRVKVARPAEEKPADA